MKIEIWSDFACPFCYIGETAMQMALKSLGLEEVQIIYKSFQLDPNASKLVDRDLNQYIADKYQITYDQAKAQNDNIIKMAEAIGLHYDFDHIQRNNTGLAHELHKYAQEKGLGQEMAHLLFSAYFEKGKDLGDIHHLLEISSELPLDLDDLRVSLEKRIFYGEVVKDQAFANQNQIQSVPLFIINDQYAITGAQSHVYFQRAFEQIMAEDQKS